MNTTNVSSDFEKYTGLSYDQVAEVFPFVEDDDEDRSDEARELEEC